MHNMTNEQQKDLSTSLNARRLDPEDDSHTNIHNVGLPTYKKSHNQGLTSFHLLVSHAPKGQPQHLFIFIFKIQTRFFSELSSIICRMALTSKMVG